MKKYHFFVYFSRVLWYNYLVSNMITLTAKYKKHSDYRGVPIFKRLPNTGTSGGMWLARSTTFKTLAHAKSYLDYLALHNNL